MFFRDAGEYVAEVLMREIVEHAEKCDNVSQWPVETDEQLSWLMQVTADCVHFAIKVLLRQTL